MTDSRMPFVTAQKALSSGTVASRLSGKTAVAERHVDHDGPVNSSTEGVGSSAYHRDKGAGFAPSDYEYADIDGAQTAYVRMGRGEPVLLLHGVGSYSYMWRNGPV